MVAFKRNLHPSSLVLPLFLGNPKTTFLKLEERRKKNNVFFQCVKNHRYVVRMGYLYPFICVQTLENVLPKIPHVYASCPPKKSLAAIDFSMHSGRPRPWLRIWRHHTPTPRPNARHAPSLPKMCAFALHHRLDHDHGGDLG